MKLYVKIKPEKEEAAIALCKQKTEHAPLEYGDYYLHQTYFQNTHSGEYKDSLYFVCDEPFSALTEPLPHIPQDFIEKVTIVDHMFDPRLFLRAATYKEGRVRAFVRNEAVRERIGRYIDMSGPTIAEVLGAIKILRRGQMPMDELLEP